MHASEWPDRSNQARPQQSMSKIVLGLFVAFLATVVAAKLVFEGTSATIGAHANQPWAQNRMEFIAWNDQQWTAWIRDGEFELVPQDTSNWTRHSNSTLAFIDWEGELWQAKVDGEAFLLAHRGDWKGETERASAIRYRDWQGDPELRTVGQLTR